MRNLLFLICICFVVYFGCASELQLSSQQMRYKKWGLGRESPQEVANAEFTLAVADGIRKDPSLLKWWYSPYGWYYGYYGWTDPCYYYPRGSCPAFVEEKSEVKGKKGGKK
jgi:hypothetical protein